MVLSRRSLARTETTTLNANGQHRYDPTIIIAAYSHTFRLCPPLVVMMMMMMGFDRDTHVCTRLNGPVNRVCATVYTLYPSAAQRMWFAIVVKYLFNFLRPKWPGHYGPVGCERGPHTTVRSFSLTSLPRIFCFRNQRKTIVVCFMSACWLNLIFYLFH